MQELVNTLDPETGEDLLTAPDGLRTFLSEQHLSEVEIGPQDLPRVRELRAALRAACLAHAGTPLPPEDENTLHRLLADAPLVLTVDAQGTAALSPDASLSGVAALTARIAAGIAAAAGGGQWTRLKACKAADCRWVYYDHSPAGQRRWCSMAVCGSRAKMRAYRAKQSGRSRRPAPAEQPPPAEPSAEHPRNPGPGRPEAGTEDGPEDGAAARPDSGSGSDSRSGLGPDFDSGLGPADTGQPDARPRAR